MDLTRARPTKKGWISRFQIEVSKNQDSVKSTFADLVHFKKSQGLYTYFSHVFDFWKFQFKKEISALFFSGREQASAFPESRPVPLRTSDP